MDLGFYQQRWNGRAVIGHQGDTEHFHSAMFHLIPDHNVGIFLSYDGDALAFETRCPLLQAATFQRRRLRLPVSDR